MGWPQPHNAEFPGELSCDSFQCIQITSVIILNLSD